MKSIAIVFFFILVNHVIGAPAQDDTVMVQAVSRPPVIDGKGDDLVWQGSKWQSIDQVWIEYGQKLDPDDFSGRYKIVWSSATNLLYFLVETVDDVWVDGYVYNRNPSLGGGYPDYDILEVFIDQNKSGGLHVFDGKGSTVPQWGSNAENAFSYHIAVNLRPDGQPATEKVVCDIAGESWSNYHIPDYAFHLPEFTVRKQENISTWEFSLQVYTDAYQSASPPAARAVLRPGDMIGLSLAYCDNDNPNESPKKRDHFIGSVWVPAAAYNDHWMNANGFGAIRLLDAGTGVKETRNPGRTGFNVYPNPSGGSFTIPAPDRFDRITVYNLLGQKVYEQSARKFPISRLHLSHLPNGVYLLHMDLGDRIATQKISVINP